MTSMLRAGIIVLVAMVAGTAAAGTLDDVRRAGILKCGVNPNLPGFSMKGPDGTWTGLDVDLCRAVAAAALGDAGKVTYTPLSSKERFTALQSGEIDLLVRNTTWTLVRDTALNLNFAGVNYYDGQGFMVRRSLGLKSALELNGAAICVLIGTTTELNLADYFRANNMRYRAVQFEKDTDVVNAYDGGKCDAYTTDRSGLAGYRLGLKDPGAHAILPEIISKEPLGPVVRHGDDQWLDLVKWALYAMFEAEEYGVNSINLDEMKRSPSPTVRRLLGVEGDLGKGLGVDNDWAVRILAQVGNYAESYDRNVGENSAINLPRGVNALWRDGGLHYPMPFR